jgi:hypothetical protein
MMVGLRGKIDCGVTIETELLHSIHTTNSILNVLIKNRFQLKVILR